MLSDSYGLERDTRLELATDAWKAPMLPLHQSRIRRTEARLKEGGIYITFILYHFFSFLSNFSFEKNILAGLRHQCLLRSRGTCIAHYACRTYFAVFLPPSVAVSAGSARILTTTRAAVRFG